MGNSLYVSDPAGDVELLVKKRDYDGGVGRDGGRPIKRTAVIKVSSSRVRTYSNLLIQTPHSKASGRVDTLLLMASRSRRLEPGWMFSTVRNLVPKVLVSEKSGGLFTLVTSICCVEKKVRSSTQTMRTASSRVKTCLFSAVGLRGIMTRISHISKVQAPMASRWHFRPWLRLIGSTVPRRSSNSRNTLPITQPVTSIMPTLPASMMRI
ncbi:hypothetical protein F5Y03DRAFT_113800 [Xylaria venustula]|nr:hypothetical protein F5Y03DRAFT_113800 [Xylaria venustula]